MRILMLIMIFASNAWATAPLPGVGDGTAPEVGKMYAYTTAYASGHHLDCPGGTCMYPYRGKLPASLANTPASSKTGGIRCPTCQIGIYLSDDSHYVFVYN